MKLFRSIVILLSLLACCAPGGTFAQSVLTPITQGLVWTPSQWTTAWQKKLDYPATTPVPLLTWTTGSRPGGPVTGGLGFNTTTSNLEVWNGTNWVSGGGGTTSPFNTAVAACTNAAGDGAIIQTAVNTGKTVFLQGPCVLDSEITVTSPGQLIYGSGRDVTELNVPTSAVGVFTHGIFYVNESGASIQDQFGPILQDFSLNLAQPDITCTVATGFISGTTLTVQSIVGGTLAVGNFFSVSTFTTVPNTKITALGSGTGGAGTYTVNISQTAGSSGSPLSFITENSCSRSNLVNYKPAVYAQNQDSLRMFRMKITGAMIGIDARNASQFVIDDLQESAFSVGMWFDGGGDTNRINNWHFWPFGPDYKNSGGNLTLTDNQNSLFETLNTACTPQTTSGNLGAIALMSGAGFLQITDHLTISGQGWCLFNSTSGPQAGFGPLVQATTVDFDTFPGLNISGGNTQISSSSFGGALHNYQAFTQSGGTLVISSTWFGNSSPIVTPTVPMIAYHGGLANSVGGAVGSLTITGSRLEAAATPAQMVLADSTAGGGAIVLEGNYFSPCTGCTYTAPIVDIPGSPTIRAKIDNNLFNDGSSGSNIAIRIATDGWNTVFNNTAPGWGLTFPSSVTDGQYACNNSSTTSPCTSGGGGGSGTVNAGTTGELGYYASSGTAISGNANLVSDSSGNLSANSLVLFNAGISMTLPTNGEIKCGGVDCMFGDGAGHTLIGEVSGNGGTGVEVQNVLFPSTNNSFTLGDTGHRWSTGYFTNINISGTCTGCSGIGTGTSGQVAVYTSSTTIGSSASPAMASPSISGTLVDGSSNGLLTSSSGTAIVGNTGTGHNLFLNTGPGNAVLPNAADATNIGASSSEFFNIYLKNAPIVSSDMRKKNLVTGRDAELGLDFIRCLTPRSYTWKKDPDGVHQGFFAQEVEACLDGRSFYGLQRDDKGFLHLAYDEFISPLTAATQDLSFEVDTLRAEIIELKAQVSASRHYHP